MSKISKKYWLEIKIIEKKDSYYKEIFEYMINYIFYDSVIISDYMTKKITYTKYIKEELINYFDNLLFNFSWYVNENINFVYWWLLKYFYSYNNKLFKKYIKNILDNKFYIYSYAWYFFVSFINKQDLSNSIQLIEDIFQWFLNNNNSLFFDDYLVDKYKIMKRFYFKWNKIHNLENYIFYWIKKQPNTLF